MEDAHLTKTDIGDGISLFAVFDGHGGREVAKFCEEFFTENLLINENFKKGEYPLALKETFFKIDVLLQSTEG